jgi:hypothetical protein
VYGNRCGCVNAMGNPRYPLELFQRVVTVSLQTMKIVRGLPKLKQTVPSYADEFSSLINL